MILVSALAGVFIAGQARVNSGLGLELGNSLLAALISFGSGLVIVSLLVFANSSQRAKLRELAQLVRSGGYPVWGLLGGALGGFFVMIQSWIGALVGIALFSVGVVAGQAVAALVLDGYGLFGLTKRKLSIARFIGIKLTLIGLLVTADLANYQFSPLLLLPFLAGIGMGVQQAINGKLGKAAASPLVATLANFVVGTSLIALTLVLLQQFDLKTLPENPVLYIGGALGVTFIFLQVVLVLKIGALVLGIALLVGQLIGSLLFDLLVPISDRVVGLNTLIGIALALAGATVVTLKR